MKWKEFLSELVQFYWDMARLVLSLAVIIQCIMGYIGSFI